MSGKEFLVGIRGAVLNAFGQKECEYLDYIIKKDSIKFGLSAEERKNNTRVFHPWHTTKYGNLVQGEFITTKINYLKSNPVKKDGRVATFHRKNSTLK